MFHDTFKYEVIYISNNIYQKYKENFKTKNFLLIDIFNLF